MLEIWVIYLRSFTKVSRKMAARGGVLAATSPIPTPQRRKLVEIANGVEAVQDRRIFIERVNEPFLAAAAGGSADQFSAGIERAIALGLAWLKDPAMTCDCSGFWRLVAVLISFAPGYSGP